MSESTFFNSRILFKQQQECISQSPLSPSLQPHMLLTTVMKPNRSLGLSEKLAPISPPASSLQTPAPQSST